MARWKMEDKNRVNNEKAKEREYQRRLKRVQNDRRRMKQGKGKAKGSRGYGLRKKKKDTAAIDKPFPSFALVFKLRARDSITR